MRYFILIFLTINCYFISATAQTYERYKKLTDTTLTSKYLGFKKDISVLVPFEWQEDLDRNFPLIIIFDKQNQRSHNYILNTIDYLTSNEQMPSSIIISLASEQKYRLLETLHKASDKNGLALENDAFIFKELIPLAEKHFKASSFRLFIGHSRYGYYSTSLFCSKTNHLNAVIAISPFFKQQNVSLYDSIIDLNNEKVNFKKYYRFAIGNDYPDDFIKMDSTLKQLSNENTNAKGSFYEQAVHNVTPGLSIAVALYEIFEDWSKIQSKYISNDQKEISIVENLQLEIEQIYGIDLAFSLGNLNGKGWYFYNEGQYGKAIEAWELLLKTYPNYSEAILYIMDAQLQLKKERQPTFERFKKSLAKTTIYTDIEKDELLEEAIKILTR